MSETVYCEQFRCSYVESRFPGVAVLRFYGECLFGWLSTNLSEIVPYPLAPLSPYLLAPLLPYSLTPSLPYPLAPSLPYPLAPLLPYPLTTCPLHSAFGVFKIPNPLAFVFNHFAVVVMNKSIVCCCGYYLVIMAVKWVHLKQKEPNSN